MFLAATVLILESVYVLVGVAEGRGEAILHCSHSSFIDIWVDRWVSKYIAT